MSELKIRANLRQLLNLRQRRQEQIQVEVKKAKSAVEAAELKLEQDKQTLLNHQAGRVQEQQNLFSTMVQQNFTPQKYAEYTAMVLGMEQYESQLQQTIQESEQAIVDAQKAYEERQQQYLNITKEVDKLAKALDKKEKSHIIALDRQEENEMDELAQVQYLRRAG